MSSALLDTDEHDESDQMPATTVEYMVKAVKAMRRRKAADAKGVMLEMFLYGGDDLSRYVADGFNTNVQSCCVTADWRESFLKFCAQGRGRRRPKQLEADRD